MENVKESPLYERVKQLTYGETLKIDDNTHIYHYFDEEHLVEIENGIETYVVQFDHRSKQLVYTSLI